jgi:hypothetical protein
MSPCPAQLAQMPWPAPEPCSLVSSSARRRRPGTSSKWKNLDARPSAKQTSKLPHLLRNSPCLMMRMRSAMAYALNRETYPRPSYSCSHPRHAGAGNRRRLPWPQALADDVHVVYQHHGNNEDDMQMTVKRFLTSVTLAASLLISVNANATDADDKLLGSMSMKDSAMAYYTASVIAYPSVCQTKLSDRMKPRRCGWPPSMAKR